MVLVEPYRMLGIKPGAAMCRGSTLLQHLTLYLKAPNIICLKYKHYLSCKWYCLDLKNNSMGHKEKKQLN